VHQLLIFFAMVLMSLEPALFSLWRSTMALSSYKTIDLLETKRFLNTI
jgi:hypothetical protein